MYGRLSPLYPARYCTASITGFVEVYRRLVRLRWSWIPWLGSMLIFMLSFRFSRVFQFWCWWSGCRLGRRGIPHSVEFEKNVIEHTNGLLICILPDGEIELDRINIRTDILRLRRAYSIHLFNFRSDHPRIPHTIATLARFRYARIKLKFILA